MKIVIFLVLSLMVWANELEQPYENLSLTQALALLKEQNSEIIQAKYSIEAVKLQSKIAQANHYGKMVLKEQALRSNDALNVFGFKVGAREATFGDFGFAEFDMQNPSPNTLKIAPKDLNFPDPRNQFSTMLEYQVPLYTGGILSEAEKISSAMKQIAVLEKDKISAKVMYELKKSYYDAHLLETFLRNLSFILINIETLENVAQSMKEEGYAKKIDVLEVQTKKSKIVRLIHQTKANQELVLQYISFLLNHEVISVDTTFEKLPFHELSNEELIANCMLVKQSTLNTFIRLSQIDMAKGKNLPQVGAFAHYKSSDNTAFGHFTTNDSYTVGAELSWNIFDGDITDKEIEVARYELLKAQSMQEYTKNAVILKLTKIKTAIKNLEFEIESLTTELDLLNEIYKNYLGRYKEQLVSINDVLIKYSLQIEKLIELQKVQNERNDLIFQLEQLQGGKE